MSNRLFTPRHYLPTSVRQRYEALPLCEGWTRSEVARFDAVADLVEYEPGDVILGQGLSRPEIVVLAAGRALKVDLSTGQRLGALQVGELAGHGAVLQNIAQPFSVVATAYAAVLHVQSQAFRSLLPTHGGLQRALTSLVPNQPQPTSAVVRPHLAQS